MTTAPSAASVAIRPTLVRYGVLGALCLAATVSYIHRNCIAIAEEDVRRDLGLSMDEMGWVMSGFFLTYAVFQVPSGWLGHVWGTRKALTVFSVLWSAATGLLALAGGFPGLLLARLGMGAAQAGIFPCSASTTTKWFPPTRRAFASGALGSFMSVGSVISASLTGFLLCYLSWRWVFALYAVPGLLWAAWFWLWFRDRPREHPAVNAEELALIEAGAPDQAADVGRPPEPTPWGALVSSRKMWAICGQQFFRAAGYIFFTSWFTTYLKETRGIGTLGAGILTSLPLLGVVVGTLAGGAVSDAILERTGSRRLARQGLSVTSMVACALLIVTAYFIDNAVLAVLVISAGSFCASFAAPCAYTITMDMGGRHVAPVFSTMNMAGNLGAFVFPLLVPPLVRAAGGWDPVLFAFAGIYLAAAVCWGLLDTDGTVFDRGAPAACPAPRSE